jgi:hypothetical protein
MNEEEDFERALLGDSCLMDGERELRITIEAKWSNLILAFISCADHMPKASDHLNPGHEMI